MSGWTSEKPTEDGLYWVYMDLGGPPFVRFVMDGVAYNLEGHAAYNVQEYGVTVRFMRCKQHHFERPDPPPRPVADLVWTDAPDRPGVWECSEASAASGARHRRWDIGPDDELRDSLGYCRAVHYVTSSRFRRIPDDIADAMLVKP